jgi:dTMP kinase
MFITFEGIEGSGKTGHLIRVWRALRERGIVCVKSREPGGTEIGNAIRNILLDPVHTRIVPDVELMPYLASRRQHIEEEIRPALDRGWVVLSDRFEDSSLAYQGYARGLGIDRVRQMSRAAGIDLKPDLTILLDLPVAEGLERARGRLLEGDTRFENESLKFHQAVRDGYLKLAAEEPERIRVIDSSRDKETVKAEVLELVLGKLGLS